MYLLSNKCKGQVYLHPALSPTYCTCANTQAEVQAAGEFALVLVTPRALQRHGCSCFKEFWIGFRKRCPCEGYILVFHYPDINRGCFQTDNSTASKIQGSSFMSSSIVLILHVSAVILPQRSSNRCAASSHLLSPTTRLPSEYFAF